jgi:hypothetical protein
MEIFEEKKTNKKFSGCKFFLIFGHQNPGSGFALTKNAGSGSALKLMRIHNTDIYNKKKLIARQG